MQFLTGQKHAVANIFVGEKNTSWGKDDRTSRFDFFLIPNGHLKNASGGQAAPYNSAANRNGRVEPMDRELTL